MRIVITGGTGFIGRRLIARLLEEGYEVVALTRNKILGENRLGAKVRVLQWDGKTAKGWEEAAEGAFAIINLAGENIGGEKWTNEQKAQIISSRILAAEAVVEAIEKASKKPKVLIQASGIGYYGDTKDQRVDESSPNGEGFLASLAKRWEEAVKPVADMGVRVAWIRTAVVLGKEGGALEKMIAPFNMYVGGPIGSGKQYFSWIHLEDEVNAIIYLLQNEQISGPINLCAPDIIRQQDFSKILGQVLRKPSWLPVPGFALKLLLGNEMAGEMLLAGQKAEPKALNNAGYEFKYPTLKTALQSILKQ